MKNSPYLDRPLRTHEQALAESVERANRLDVESMLARSEEEYERQEALSGDLPGHEVWRRVRRIVNNG